MHRDRRDGSRRISTAPSGYLWRSRKYAAARPGRRSPGTAASARPGSKRKHGRRSGRHGPAAWGHGPVARRGRRRRSPSTPPLVTTMPAAVDTSSEGICEHQAIAGAQGREGRCGVGERHVIADQPDGEAANDVDRGDDQPGDRVAADELRGTVHRTVETALFLQVAAARCGRSFRRSGRRTYRRRSPFVCRAWNQG